MYVPFVSSFYQSAVIEQDKNIYIALIVFDITLRLILIYSFIKFYKSNMAKKSRKFLLFIYSIFVMWNNIEHIINH